MTRTRTIYGATLCALLLAFAGCGEGGDAMWLAEHGWQVTAVDISQKFLDHIEATSREAGQLNVDTLLVTADSTELPPKSVDVAFICDTYHHFEFPAKTMESLYRAMKPGGRVAISDIVATAPTNPRKGSTVMIRTIRRWKATSLGSRRTSPGIG